ncbi:hypothetical protein BJ508DRAFT_311570 [Ascobolus immersus RN42]|uniref:Uncharacterized protein n=1 Tax=Ascobolus immersus RN42 TaxID=1160509 RepID=A0A3N4HTY2_ASCIM|nr:hypothetical protein BJ508DRAFT_311570 [Ascobolus immersus RN42]
MSTALSAISSTKLSTSQKYRVLAMCGRAEAARARTPPWLISREGDKAMRLGRGSARGIGTPEITGPDPNPTSHPSPGAAVPRAFLETDEHTESSGPKKRNSGSDDGVELWCGLGGDGKEHGNILHSRVPFLLTEGGGNEREGVEVRLRCFSLCAGFFGCCSQVGGDVKSGFDVIVVESSLGRVFEVIEGLVRFFCGVTFVVAPMDAVVAFAVDDRVADDVVDFVLREALRDTERRG